MLKARMYLRVVATPVLLATVGCTISLRNPSVMTARSNPESMFAMARALERQGHPDQAKVAYSRVLALQPDHPTAKSSLDTLIAKESQRKIEQQQLANSAMSQKQYVAGSRRLQLSATQSIIVQQQRAVPNPVNSAGYSPTAQAAQTRSSYTQANHQNYTAPQNQPNPLPAVPKLNSVPVPNPPSGVIDAIHSDQPTQSVIQEPAAIPQVGRSAEGEETPGILRIQSAPVTPTEPEIQKAQATEEQAALHYQRPWLVPVQSSVAMPSCSTQLVSYNVSDEISLPPELTGPVPPTPIVSLENSPRPLSISAEIREVEKAIDCHPIANPALHPFFKPFHIELITKLKSEREIHLWPLVGLVADKSLDGMIRSRAVFLLGAMGRDAVATVPVLHAQLCTEADRFLQVDIAEAILKISPNNTAAAAVLIGCLKETDPKLQTVAAFALRNVETQMKAEVVDHLKTSLKSNSPRLQRQILLTLAEFGPASTGALPEMEAALINGDPATREVARMSLACVVRSYVR